MSTYGVTSHVVVTEWLDAVQLQLASLGIEERAAAMADARARVELELDLAHIGPTDVEAARDALAGIGEPAMFARRYLPAAQASPSLARELDLPPCRGCGHSVSTEAMACPNCGAVLPSRKQLPGTGYEYKSAATFRGWPLVHVAWGRDSQGRRRVARGVIAIGQFGIGAITIAQFGVGLVFGFGQFVAAPLAIGQFAFGLLAAGQFGIGIVAGAGQFATGIFAAGMKAFGVWVRSVF